MESYILFHVGRLNYALPLEQVYRILMAQNLERSSTVNVAVEGMMPFEESVIDVYSFRKMIGLPSMSQELKEMFEELKNQHTVWLHSLEDSIREGVKFTKTFNSHECHLGKWIDGFHSYDESVIPVLRNLTIDHRHFHEDGKVVLDLSKIDRPSAIEKFEIEIINIYNNTFGYIDQMSTLSLKIASDIQKLLILKGADNTLFGVNVDHIDNIIHIEQSQIRRDERLQRKGKYMNIVGVMEHDGVLRSVISEIKTGNVLKKGESK
jgi:chemotaxis signal transduction protein